MRNFTDKRGFTMIELMIVVAIIGLVATVAIVGVQNSVSARRDVTRLADVKSLQQALGLYLAKAQSYVAYTGCIDGSDPVTAGLRAEGMIAASATFADPSAPSNPAGCYYYESPTGSNYTLRYVLEKSSNAGQAGVNVVVP